MVSVAHLTQSASTLGGGIPEAIRSLMRAQQAAGVQPRLVSVADAGGSLGNWPGGEPIWLEGRRGPGMLRLSGISRVLDVLGPELIHTHGIWTWLSIGVPQWARANRRPYVVSPHGMLDGWALANSRWKKVLAGAVFERRHLQGAACLHALCESEAAAIRAYGLKNRVRVIPNGIELPDGAGSGEQRAESEERKKILLFLGRLHPKKGLVNALRAWWEVRKRETGGGSWKEWQFVIAGWDQGGHEAELKALCDELGLAHAHIPIASFLAENGQPKSENSQVIFVGSAFGQEKDALLRTASAYILPSFSEGLPMSVLEAWAYRLPVLMTDHCNLPEGFEAGAALRIGTDVASIEAGMVEIMRAAESSLRGLGENGRALVEARFTWAQIAKQMSEMYDQVLAG